VLYEKDEEMLLLFITRHLREQNAVKNITLYMPYIPHARMDRVKNKQEVFTLKYFCEFINSLCFDRVVVRDAHSSVSLALLNNVVVELIDTNIKKLVACLLDPEKDIVFYPDEGSSKRYLDIIGFPCAFGVKKRDWNTGKITGLDVQGDLPSPPFNVLIIDDISSYGGTFLHSAQKLKELGADRMYLYITHCENSILNGELIHSGLLEKIYTTRSIYTGEYPLIAYIDT
jgi:ribose-phosphate pyrophosphokinase